MFHHICNGRLVESLQDMRNKMTSLLSKAEEEAKKFTAVCKTRRGYRKSSAAKKRKMIKRMKIGKRRYFKRT